MKITNLVFLCTLACATVYIWHRTQSPCSAQALKDTIIIGTNAEYPPYSFIQNGIPVGFDIDIAHEVVRRLGKKERIVDMPFDMLLPQIQLGDIHMIAAGISPKPTRARHVHFTKPYLENDPLLIITPATQQPLSSVDDLADKTVVVNDGYTSDAYMSTRKTNALIRLATPAEAFLALRSGRADAYVAAHSSVQRFLEKYPNAYHTVEIKDVTDAYALVISPVYPELVVAVQEALDAMERDGTLAALKKTWGFL